MAVRLSTVLGGSAESWSSLQDSYDIWNARKKRVLPRFHGRFKKALTFQSCLAARRRIRGL